MEIIKIHKKILLRLLQSGNIAWPKAVAKIPIKSINLEFFEIYLIKNNEKTTTAIAFDKKAIGTAFSIGIESCIKRAGNAESLE